MCVHWNCFHHVTHAKITVRCCSTLNLKSHDTVLKWLAVFWPHKFFRKIRIKNKNRTFKQGHPGLFVSQSVVSYSWHTCWNSYKSTWIVLCHHSVPWKRSRYAGRMTVCPALCPAASSHVLMPCPYASEHIQSNNKICSVSIAWSDTTLGKTN